MRLNRSDAEHYRLVFDNYKRASGKATAELREAIEWGMQRGHLSQSLEDWISYHVAMASEALRTDCFTDDQGRKVRRRHALELQGEDPETGKPVQRHLWGDMDSPIHFLENSIRQRLQKVRADFRAVQADAEYIASQRPDAFRLLQMLSNFDPRADRGEGYSEAGG